MHPVFHVLLLKLWRLSEWSCPADAPVPKIDEEEDKEYRVERILWWRWTGWGRRRKREFLVTWEGYPLEDAQWIPASNFTDPASLEEQIQQDKPIEERSSSGHWLPNDILYSWRISWKGGVVVVNGLAWTTILYPVIEIAEPSDYDAKLRNGAEGWGWRPSPIAKPRNFAEDERHEAKS